METTRARNSANLRPFDSDRAREAGQRSGETRRRKHEERTLRRPRHMTADEWHRFYWQRAFDGDWLRWLRTTQRDLESRYAPVKAQAPQYVAMTWRLSVLMALAAMLDVEAGPGLPDEPKPGPRPDLLADRLKVEKMILAYVDQLQRYTEAAKYEVEVSSAARRDALETVVLVAERVLEAATRQRFIEALMVIIERGESGDPAKIAALLPGGQPVDGEADADAAMSAATTQANEGLPV